MPTTCLIAGGCGFIGSHLADRLVRSGYRVRLFDKTNVSTRRVDHLQKDIDLITGDFSNQNDLVRALSGVDIVFQMISETMPQASVENPGFDLMANVAPMLTWLEYMVRERKISKLVFPSSGGTVYGIPRRLPLDEDHPLDPICPYGIGKLAIEKYLHFYHHAYGLPYAVVRISNPYGPRQGLETRQGFVAHLIRSTLARESIEVWGDGEVARDFIYIEDVTDALQRVAEHKGVGGVYNIGTGRASTLNAVMDLMETISGSAIGRTYKPKRDYDIPVNYLDIRRAERELGWKPATELKTGLEWTWAFVKRTQG